MGFSGVCLDFHIIIEGECFFFYVFVGFWLSWFGLVWFGLVWLFFWGDFCSFLALCWVFI